MAESCGEILRLLEGVEHTPMMDGLVARTNRHQGSAAASSGDNQQASALFEQALALAREVGSQWIVAYALLTLGARALDEAEYEKAVSYYSDCLPLFRDINDVTGIACTLAGLGTVA